MVVKIRTGKSIRGAISYNERKVKANQAEFLGAVNFPADGQKLGFTQKLQCFQALNELRPKRQTNTVHISLNFLEEDKLSPEQMEGIAKDYMKRIGFGEQPYLLYRHKDTDHPHVHIVASNICSNAEVIPLHNLGREKSEPARKDIEREYFLIPAESRSKIVKEEELAIEVLPAQYGKEPTKHKITNTIINALSRFHFCNLEEWNVILNMYNIVADPGRVGSRQRSHSGIVYYMTDGFGNKKGRGIKASDINGNPGMRELRKKFKRSELRKAAILSQRLSVVKEILGESKSLDQLHTRLERKGFRLRVSPSMPYDIEQVYIVDRWKGAVFTSADMGIGVEEINRIRSIKTTASRINPTKTNSATRGAGSAPSNAPAIGQNMAMLSVFLNPSLGQPGPGDDPIPKKKKRKRRPPL